MSKLKIRVARWAWFGERHGELRMSAYRDLYEDLARLGHHNPVLFLSLIRTEAPPDQRLRDLGLYEDDAPFPAGLEVIDSRHVVVWKGADKLLFVLGRKGSAVRSTEGLDPGRSWVAAAADAVNFSRWPPGFVVKSVTPVADFRMYDARPAGSAPEEKPRNWVQFSAVRDDAYRIVNDLDKKLKNEMRRRGSAARLFRADKNGVAQLDAIIRGTAPRFWINEVRMAAIPSRDGLAAYAEAVYDGLLKRRDSPYLFWRTRRLLSAMRRAGVEIPPRLAKGLARIRKLRKRNKDNG